MGAAQDLLHAVPEDRGHAEHVGAGHRPQGLEALLEAWRRGEWDVEPGDEDVHSAVERRLTEAIGEPGKRLHTGRSRNDQVATDMRLWLRRASARGAGGL